MPGEQVPAPAMVDERLAALGAGEILQWGETGHDRPQEQRQADE
jgi:hypothetical protein